MKHLLITLSLLALTACSKPVEIISVPDKPKLNLSLPEPLSLQPVEFKVVTIENSQNVLQKNPAMICVTGQTYQNMAENHISTISYIEQQTNIINSYKKYYESPVK